MTNKVSTTKADIVNEIAKSTGAEKVLVQSIVEAFMDNVRNSLIDNKHVYLRATFSPAAPPPPALTISSAPCHLYNCQSAQSSSSRSSPVPPQNYMHHILRVWLLASEKSIIDKKEIL